MTNLITFLLIHIVSTAECRIFYYLTTKDTFLRILLPPFPFPPRGKGYFSFPRGGRLGRGLKTKTEECLAKT